VLDEHEGEFTHEKDEEDESKEAQLLDKYN
jgi:hypothetical protein